MTAIFIILGIWATLGLVLWINSLLNKPKPPYKGEGE